MPPEKALDPKTHFVDDSGAFLLGLNGPVGQANFNGVGATPDYLAKALNYLIDRDQLLNDNVFAKFRTLEPIMAQIHKDVDVLSRGADSTDVKSVQQNLEAASSALGQVEETLKGQQAVLGETKSGIDQERSALASLVDARMQQEKAFKEATFHSMATQADVASLQAAMAAVQRELAATKSELAKTRTEVEKVAGKCSSCSVQ